MNSAEDQWKIYTCDCGKNFIPTPKYTYKLMKKMKTTYYCSYTCWRKAGGGNGNSNKHGIW